MTCIYWLLDPRRGPVDAPIGQTLPIKVPIVRRATSMLAPASAPAASNFKQCAKTGSPPTRDDAPAFAHCELRFGKGFSLEASLCEHLPRFSTSSLEGLPLQRSSSGL